MGCEMTLTRTDSGFTVSGNTCGKGYKYAVDEAVSPKRMVTSLVRTADGGVVPVKTCKAISKDKIFDALKAIKSVTAPCGVNTGDVIICFEGINIVATDSRYSRGLDEKEQSAMPCS